MPSRTWNAWLFEDFEVPVKNLLHIDVNVKLGSSIEEKGLHVGRGCSSFAAWQQ